jgi:hypothetical protein
MNIGMEVTPYWLKSRPNLSRAQYLNPGLIQTIKQTFTLSAATVKDTVTGNNNLGVGFRFQIVKALLMPDFYIPENRIKEIEKIFTAITAVKENSPEINTPKKAIDAIAEELKGEISDDEITKMKIKAQSLTIPFSTLNQFCDAIMESYTTERLQVTKKIIELENTRVGFSLEVAGASKFMTSTENEPFERAGFWVNANYYFTEQDAWTVTARILASTKDSTAISSDIGISYIRLEKNYNVSVEAMMRWNRTEMPDFNQVGQPITRINKDFTYRIAAQMSYSVTEDVSLNLSVGKAFDDPVISATGFFSLIGLNYSVFNKRLADK